MFFGSFYELVEDVEDVKNVKDEEDVEDEHQLSKKEIFGQIKKNQWNEGPGPRLQPQWQQLDKRSHGDTFSG